MFHEWTCQQGSIPNESSISLGKLLLRGKPSGYCSLAQDFDSHQAESLSPGIEEAHMAKSAATSTSLMLRSECFL